MASLYVLKDFSGLGVGTKLLRESEKMAERVGDKLWLSVNVENSRGVEFYDRRGYHKIGETYFHLDDGRYRNYVLVRISA